jgi:DNA-binding NtrC family response regulator
MARARILIVDDEQAMLENCERLLSREGYDCTCLAEPLRFREVAAATEPDVIITDVRMPNVNGMTILAAGLADDRTRPIILMTAFATIAAAVSAVREGAFDYITKPFTADQLLVATERAVRYRRLTVENRSLREQVEQTPIDDAILGSSTVMRRVLEQASKAAPTDANVLITGESGTGKELVALFVHAHSLRHDKPFVVVDCAALPEGLLESELFGHERGAFTGAIQRTEGLLAKANGGTVFFDEIAELGLGVQSKLLRVLEQRRMRRVGDSRVIDLDIRVLAATNHDLRATVAAGRFRDDLFYRLDVVELRLPTLRERKDDIPVLLNAFLEEFGFAAHRPPPQVTPEAWSILQSYSWPGNVRELRNAAQRLVVLDNKGFVAAQDLESVLQPRSAQQQGEGTTWPIDYTEAEEKALREFRAQYVRRLLEIHGGNVSRAAIGAGVSRRTLHRWLAEINGMTPKAPS